jgi:flagellar biogenesis protein FliO
MVILLVAAGIWSVQPRAARSQEDSAMRANEAGTPAENQTSQEQQPPTETEEQAPYQYEEPEFGENQVSYPMMVLRTIGIMGAVLIGLFLLYRLLIKRRNRIVTDSQVVNVLATYPLAANRTIQVVDIAGKILVLGVSDSAVNLITQVEDQETIDRIKLLSTQDQGGQGRFKDQLMRILGGGFSQPGKTSRPGQVSQLSGYRRRIERMRKME